MQTVEVTLDGRSYPIYIGERLLNQAELIARHLPQKRAALITDTTLAPLYLDKIVEGLQKAGVTVTQLIIPAGEQHKSWQSLNSVFDTLIRHRCERKTALIALGGGVIGDTTCRKPLVLNPRSAGTWHNLGVEGGGVIGGTTYSKQDCNRNASRRVPHLAPVSARNHRR